MQRALRIGLRSGSIPFSTGPTEIPLDAKRVLTALTDALEATEFIAASAQQAYLEADPAARGQPEAYTARYKVFACSQVEDAIAAYDKLSKNLGEARMQELRTHETFGLALADSLLARDKLRASIRSDEDRMKRKIQRGLQKEDLIFCEGPS